MKKFRTIFSLLICVLLVGVIFVGCSKEKEETYFTDVYDFWFDQTIGDDASYFDESKTISFNSENINKLLSADFSELKNYQTLLQTNNKNIKQLSFLFIHDPKLEGKELKTAKNNVADYKNSLEAYKSQISDFKNDRTSFETTCSNMTMNENVPVVGIIEQDAYQSMKQSYVDLIESQLNCYNKMLACANSMYLNYKDSDFGIGELTTSVKSYYFETKYLITNFMFEMTYKNIAQLDETTFTTTKTAIDKIFKDIDEEYTTINKMEQDIAESSLNDVNKKIKSLSVNILYFNNEYNLLKQAIENKLFKTDMTDVDTKTQEGAKISQNYQIFENLVNTTAKNLSKTYIDLVAFYK